MKKLFLLILLFTSIWLGGQNNLTDTELELIQLSLQKSYELKNANNDLMIDSIESKAIRQNFIPTLTMNGKNQHIASQIVAISDFFDALRSWRPYRKSLDTREVLVLMKKNAGTDFNPMLVDNFVRAFLTALAKQE